ncbi:MAG TPA: hypothetical protein PLX77_02950 [Candidatus Cloacimonadota bacterium]|nr:hypothetical protein [Candidatus Cloacimonadota bacterium]
MRSFDRMEWPRRFKLKGSVLLLVVIGIILGVLIQHKANRDLSAQIEISDLSFNAWGTQFIELGYDIENKSDKTQTLKLLAEVWDQDDIELASALFEIKVPAHTHQTRSKMLDRLHRSLRDGEAPKRANVKLYLRKVF